MTIAWAGRYIEVHVEGPWEFVKRARGIGAAVILAITDAAEVVLVEQHRHPLNGPALELPAGLIGDEAAGEDAAVAAARELEEETGFRAAQWTDMGTFASSPGLVGETFRLFRAHGLTRVGPGGGLPGEGITVHVVTLTDVVAFVAARRAAGVTIDAKLLPLLIGL